MIRRVVLLCVAVLGAAWAGQTIYGPSGATFVPGGFIAPGHMGVELAGDFSPSLAQTNLLPVQSAVRGVFLDHRLEIALSTTWRSVDGSGYHPQKGRLALPVVPSFKYALAESRGRRVAWGYSGGFAMPYGVYAAGAVQFRFPLLQPEFNIGLGTPLVLQRAYSMGYARLRLADLSGEPLPIAFIAEGAWAGSAKRLGETEEGFGSLGVEVMLGRSAALRGSWRRDPKTYLQIDSDDLAPRTHQNTGGVWAMNLDFQFDMPKTDVEAKP